uniref:Uncharacterized protein n=1 Tax=Cucumis melo TaxID=3656 RepID=A0A9I9E3J9_CUCME
ARLGLVQELYACGSACDRRETRLRLWCRRRGLHKRAARLTRGRTRARVGFRKMARVGSGRGAGFRSDPCARGAGFRISGGAAAAGGPATHGFV